MSSHKNARLTLDERLALAAQSRASSPEAAAALVKSLAALPAGYVFCGGDDVEAMYALTGECWEDPRVDIDSYRGFCPLFELTLRQGMDTAPNPSQEERRYRPLCGVRSSNALVLLGEMLLDHAMGRRHGREVYHCLRMTLGQYLDALTGPDFRRSESEEEWFQCWRTDFSKGCSEDQPLTEVLAGILRRYMAGWETFGRLDYVLRCLGGLACHLEQAGTKFALENLPESERQKEGASALLTVSRTKEAQAAIRCRTALQRFDIGLYRDELPKAESDCPAPQGYFLKLAQDYAPGLPDPGSEMKAKTLRDQIFLPDWCCGIDIPRELAELSFFPEFVPLLKECLSEGRLTAAMEEINAAVTDLYMLWVEPYLWMEKTA